MAYRIEKPYICKLLTYVVVYGSYVLYLTHWQSNRAAESLLKVKNTIVVVKLVSMGGRHSRLECVVTYRHHLSLITKQLTCSKMLSHSSSGKTWIKSSSDRTGHCRIIRTICIVIYMTNMRTKLRWSMINKRVIPCPETDFKSSSDWLMFG